MRSNSVSAIYSTFANFKLSHYATRTIRQRSGLKNALDHLVSEKLLNFAGAVERHSEFAAELPRFQAAVWEVFHPYELAGYLASLRPMPRKKLQKLLYLRGAARAVARQCPNCSILSRQSNPSNFNYGARVKERRHAFRELGRFEPRVCNTRLRPERRRPKLDLAKRRYREVSQPLRRLPSGSYEQPTLAVSGRILGSFQEQG